MNKTEQELADELDTLLTAQLRGQQPVAKTELTSEAQLAQDLLNLATSTKPAPLFLTRLEKRLTTAASTKPTKNTNPLPKPSFWQPFLDVKEGFTMKRTFLTVGSLVLLLVAVAAAWLMFRDNATQEVSSELPTPPATVISDPNLLPHLPVLTAVQGGMGGGGGMGSGIPQAGGNVAIEAATQPNIAADGPVPSIDMPIYYNPFEGSTFVLNTTLPTEPTQALVQQQTAVPYSLETARALANQFGFTGPLYTQSMPQVVPQALPAEGTDPNAPVSSDAPVLVDPVGQVPTIYYAFDGTKALNIFESGAFYSDTSITYNNTNTTTFAEAAPIAENFAKAHNLLSFPYVVQDGQWGNVFFMRLVDGKPINQPELMISIYNGQIASISYQLFNGLETLGNYPLQTADTAWQYLQANIQNNNIPYNIYPVNTDVPSDVVEPPSTYQSWYRTYQPGEEAHIYSWPTIYQPAEAGGLPRVEIYPFVLQAADDQLKAIADQINSNNPIHAWGQVAADGKTLVVAGWESITNYTGIYLQGKIQRIDNEVRVVASTGETYILPNAPADLTDGLDVSLYGGGSRNTGLAFPVLDWQNIDKNVDMMLQPEGSISIPVEGSAGGEGGAVAEPGGPITIDPPIEGYTPPSYGQISINQVELVYYVSYVYPEYKEGEPVSYSQPPAMIQPAWKFSGTASTGEKMEFFIQAVTPELIQAPQG